MNNHNLKIQYSKNDEYYTPVNAITPLIKYLKPNSTILCPFDTEQSNFCKVLNNAGHNVYYSHIEDGNNFFWYEKEDVVKYDYIISNPPYSIKNEVFKKLNELNKPYAMLIGCNGIFESKRFDLLNNCEIMVFNKRIKYFNDFNDQQSTTFTSPPFSSWYICKGVLPERLVFEKL